MLLRNIPLPNDPDIFAAMSTHTPQRSPSPPRPTYHSTDHTTTSPDNESHLDDVWGDEIDEIRPTSQPSTAQQHPSDMPRLQQEHTTAGYRDGITAAKATSVQAGFDEGYGLGATIGLRAGELLGVLEGLVAASITDHLTGQRDAIRLQALIEDARRELSVQQVFRPEYWHEDGTWKYQVRGVKGPPDDHDDGEAVFADVAAAHPLLKKWDGVVKAEAERFRLDWHVWKLEAEEERRKEEEGEEEDRHHHGHGHGHGVEKKGHVKVAVKGKAALEW